MKTIAGLIALGLVPALAGAARLNHAAPWAMKLHIVFATAFALLGAFQFSSDFRRRRPRWHRVAGRILVPSGLIVSITGLWMTLFYPTALGDGPARFDGPAVYWTRLGVGLLMTLSVALGVDAIRRRAFKAHEAWMIRAYALGMGAGTQVFTHLPWFLLPEIQGETSRAICMASGWAINAVIAERVIRKAG